MDAEERERMVQKISGKTAQTMFKPCNNLFAQISSAPTLHYAAPVVPAGFLDRFAVL